MRKGDNGFSLLIIFALALPFMWILLSGNGFINFGNTSNSTISTPNSTNCQSYIDQIDSLNGQISQLNTDLSNARNNDSGGFSMTELFIGFIIGAGIVIAYFYYHEKTEKEREAFDKLYLNKKARKK